MSTPQVPQLALTLRRLPRRGRAESVTTRDRFGRTILPAAHVLDGRSQFRPAHPLRSLRTLHQVDLEKPPQVSDRVLREVSRPDNVRDDPLAPPHVSHGRETLKPPQVRARVAVGTMPCGRARVWAPGWHSGGPSTGRSRLGARPARAGARERAWWRQMTRSHAFLNAVRLAGTEQPRQGSSGRGGRRDSRITNCT